MAGRKERRKQMVKYEKGKKKLESCKEERKAKKKERSLRYAELMEGRKEGRKGGRWREEGIKDR